MAQKTSADVQAALTALGVNSTIQEFSIPTATAMRQSP